MTNFKEEISTAFANSRQLVEEENVRHQQAVDAINEQYLEMVRLIEARCVAVNGRHTDDACVNCGFESNVPF